MKKYIILYWTDGQNTVASITPWSENPGLEYPEAVLDRIDADLYTAKEQLEAIGIDCTLIDQQTYKDNMSGV